MIPYTIESELHSGETLYWKGKPKDGLILRPMDIFLIPFSFIWGGGVLSMTKEMLFNPKSSNPDFFFSLPLLFFVVIACYLIFGRFILDVRMRKNTYYAVTNERAIIVSGLLSKKVQSINLNTISDISVTEKANGKGTISFADSAMPFGRAYRGFPGLYGQGLIFEMIDDVRNVNSMIQKSRQGI